METIKKSITITAPKEKVWEILTNEPFRDIWLSEFSPNSQVGGDYTEGGSLIFLNATGNGLKCRVTELKEYELIKMDTIANIKNGVEDTTSEEFESWKETGDAYILSDINGDTNLKVESRVPSKKHEQFTELWSKALHKIKEIAEEI